jgi:hypothetical protein
MDAATSLATAEQALRDLLSAVMYQMHGRNWMDEVIKPEQRQRWREIREQETKQRVGHVLGGVNDLSYAYLGELIELIKAKGCWKEHFEEALGSRVQAFALLDLLQTLRRPVDHARPLLPFEEDLASGIAGLIRNRVTIYLSKRDPDGDYYPRVERIEDSLGNSFIHSPESDLSGPVFVRTQTTLRVGQTVVFRCEGTDPQGRPLTWGLTDSGSRATGDRVDLQWEVQPLDTGPKKSVSLIMTHNGVYHRNPKPGLPATDANIVFIYRVLPPE